MGQKNDLESKFLSINLTRQRNSRCYDNIASMLKNRFSGHPGVFWPFFRALEAKNARNSCVASAWTRQKSFFHNLETFEIFLEKKSCCATKTCWDK